MNEQNEFKPTSKTLKFIDRYQKAYQNTRIEYQHGRLNGKKVLQLFFDGKPFAIRSKTGKYRDTSFDIQAYGGQDMHAAQSQREICLQNIVTHLFQHFGCQVELEPKLEEFTPDVLITKQDLKIYVELKAYHRQNLCGDVEISQAMKYFEMASRVAETNNQTEVPKTILITSADLIKRRESYLSHPNIKPKKYVKTFYKKYIQPRKYINSMDKFTSKMMYIHAPEKFQKNRKIGFRDMNVFFSHEIDRDRFPAILFEPSEYDVLLMDAELTYDILKKEGLDQDAHYFKLLREAKLEKLVLNRELLEFPES